MKLLCQRAFSFTSVHLLHLTAKLPLSDANDRDGCYHISPFRHLHRRAPPQTHTPARTLATSCGCVHVLTSCSIALFISQPSCHGSTPFSLSVSPFLSPCNLTLSTLVSCLFANTDCSRPGLDFPVLTSPLLYLIFQCISTPTPHPLTHSCVFVLPRTLPIFVWFLRTCVFLENIPPSCSFGCCLFLNLRLFFLFPTSDWFPYPLLLLPLSVMGAK